MAYTTINKHTDYFNTVLWTGNSGTQSITGVGFQPDFIWGKVRADNNNTGENGHILTDAVRGNTKYLQSNNTNAEATASNTFTSFDSDGFSLGNKAELNSNTNTYVAWNWKAGGAGSANTDGDINSTVSVNQAAGFSIVKYTGSGSAQTVGHGLNAVPKLIIVKRIPGNGYDWVVYHKDDTAGLYLNTDGYNSDSSSNNIWFNGAAPTSSVFTTGTDGRIGNAVEYIAYCFAEKVGYSKFGSYVGNGQAAGTFVYTGFKPQFIIQKPASATQNWQIHDTKRHGYNVKNYNLSPNSTGAEAENDFIDIYSNGFKNRTNGALNAGGTTYIYMAFGQSIVGSNNVCATAR